MNYPYTLAHRATRSFNPHIEKEHKPFDNNYICPRYWMVSDLALTTQVAISRASATRQALDWHNQGLWPG